MLLQMKRFLLFFLVFFSLQNALAQLDREHWFAPMVDDQSFESQVQRIYMSTNEVTPFRVDIYNNNIIIGTVTISKGNPVFFQAPNRSQIIVDGGNSNELFRPVNKGYYLKGEKPFFASLRFSVQQHGEILTSKGTAGIGTEFRAAMAPLTVQSSNLNFMTSVMATEDNTTVTITGFNSNIQFSDFVPRTQFNFTLNKGQSYIINGSGSYSQNWSGFIGAKIVSDKPISITNGNFNGQYAGNFGSSSDILMDQGVPTDKLGQDFVLMKGNGTTSSNMEKALVVANENGTQIYLNNNPIPVATLNAGQHYLTPNNAYILQGGTHYNMYIHTSKNAYVYQLLAGVAGNGTEATGGFNYIPPLSCYLPKKIDEIGFIDQNRVYLTNSGWFDSIPTKLNIITERGATVTIARNGVNFPLNSGYGPYDVLGNTNWVTYSVPNITGNIAVTSSHAVTAGISAGNGAVGYGGYFAGFSYTPAIIKQDGECLPGVVLSVTEGFNHYLWLLKDASGNYNPAPGINNTNTYEPTQAGIYAVEIQQGSCPQIQTQDYKFYNCTTYTNTNHDICTTKTITPEFALSSQALNPASVNIVTQPTKGTVVKNADGTITYTANLNATGTDTFKFSFCGVGAIPDCETVQATINLNQVEHYNVTLNECSTNGSATYNLTNAAVTPDTSATKTYYQTLNGAENQIAAEVIGNFTNFTTTDRFVYVRITNSFGCYAIAQIELKSLLAPAVNPNLYTTKHCDEDVDGIIDGVYKLDLTTITPIVLQNATSFVVKYYDNPTDANNDAANTITGVFTFTGNTSVWIRVNTTNGCPSVVREIPIQIGNKVPLIANNIIEKVCDNDGNGSQSINLNDYIPLFYSGTATATFYNTLANAQNNTSAINATQNLTGNRTIYYRIKVSGFCDEIGILNLELNAGTPSTQLLANYPICEGTTQTLDPGTGYNSYSWSTGATSQTINVSAGTYWVDLTNTNGCTYRQSVTVTEELKAQLNAAAYNGANCDTNFDGIINVKFSTQVTPVILPSAAGFTVTYSTDGFLTTLPDNWTYSTPTVVQVKVQGTVCPPIIQSINFGFGSNVPLIANTSTQGVCDNGNGSQAVNLSTYISQFYSGTGATARYFETLANAQSNTGNIPASQTLTSDKTFYIRIKVANYCDVIVTLNLELNSSTPSTQLLANYTICEGTTQTLDPGTGYNSYSWSTGATSQTINVSAGTYWVDLTNTNGCTYRQSVTVTEELKAQLNAAAYNGANCDTNFDGIINVKFSTQVTPVILPSAAGFTVTYSTDGFLTTLPDNWTYSTPTVVQVKVQGTVCPPIIQSISFGFGNNVPLIANTITQGICDNDLNGSQAVNLSTYISQFYSGTGATARYFETLANAQNNTGNVSASQTLTGNETFYIRIKVANYCDVIVTLNLELNSSTPSTQLLPSYTICQTGATQTLDPGSGYTAYRWSNNATTQTITVGPGNYWVNLTNAHGCVYRQNVSVVGFPVAQLNVAAYNGIKCDENFDGQIDVKFSTEVTPIVLTNSANYTVRYYTTQAFADAGGNNNLADNWSYSTATTLYIRVDSPYCPYITKPINFGFGNKVTLLNQTQQVSVCDDDLDGIKAVDLSNYKSLFTTDNSVVATYFATLQEAYDNINPLTNPVTTSGVKKFYIRFSKNNLCTSVGELEVTIKTPRASSKLRDLVICPDTTTLLDAGSGFDSYVWSTGDTSQTITAGAGDYWVDLTYNGCVYRQSLTITEYELPQIVSIDIVGTTVTINVTGGTPPYRYSIDGVSYQDSNIFNNVPAGQNTAYVISADQCAPVTQTFVVIRLLNVITPNGDGLNDKLNYSDLLYKEDVLLKIYDRNGALIFTGDQSNNYTWDGKINGRPVTTASYWYILQWKDPGAVSMMKYSGWVLVKSRE